MNMISHHPSDHPPHHLLHHILHHSPRHSPHQLKGRLMPIWLIVIAPKRPCSGWGTQERSTGSIQAIAQNTRASTVTGPRSPLDPWVSALPTFSFALAPVKSYSDRPKTPYPQWKTSISSALLPEVTATFILSNTIRSTQCTRRN